MYLKNDICNFEILTEYDTQKKYNILSACFFKMEKHYKNFYIYVTRLKKLIALLETQTKYMLRIFIDEHIKNDFSVYNMLKKSNKVHIILFKCKDYMNNNYHVDVFGSLVRLFPLFDFENNDVNNVIIIDIDLNDEDLIRLQSLISYETQKSEIIGMGTANALLIMKEEPHFFCGLFAVYNQKFDKKIIVDFIKNAHTITDRGIYGKRINTYGYGIDEIFLNKYFIYNESNKQMQNVNLGLLFQYNVYYFLYYYRKELLIENPNDTYNYLKHILGEYYLPNMTIENMFDEMDKLTYGIYSYDLKKIYISKRYYELIDTLCAEKKEWFSLENIKLIKKYFYNVVDCISVIYFDKENLNIKNIDIIKENMVQNKYSK